MKDKKLLLILLLVAVAAAGAVVLMTSSSTSLLYFEKRSGDGMEASYLYLNEERSYTFEIDSPTYCCVEFESREGVCYVEIIDADGEYLVDTFATGYSGYHFDSETDITVNLKFVDHSGGFRIAFSKEPILY